MNHSHEIAREARFQGWVTGLLAVIGLKDGVYSVAACQLRNLTHLICVRGRDRAHESPCPVSGQEVFRHPAEAIQDSGVKPGYPAMTIMHAGLG